MVTLPVIHSKSRNRCSLPNGVCDNERICSITVELHFNNWILNHTTFSALECHLCFSCTLYEWFGSESQMLAKAENIRAQFVFCSYLPPLISVLCIGDGDTL